MWSSSPTTIRAPKSRPSIRAEIMAAAPCATEIGDRAEAIREAVGMLTSGDTLIVAGKGHEEGQTIGW
jgi:UDP-N-acetylmuramoyl-L-alanyl-D-glutamate--2,6-diaminopimelate ligase